MVAASGAEKLLDQLQLDQTENDSPENIANRINKAFLNPLHEPSASDACDTDDEFPFGLNYEVCQVMPTSPLRLNSNRLQTLI
jgi:hypothetical protein